MWFLLKILHVRGKNTCLCKGELCFIFLGGASFSLFFLYTGLVTIFTYIVLIFDIYIYMMYVFFTYLYMCCFFFIFIHMFSLLYAIFYFCFTLRSRDEFCLKCFKNTGYQSHPCHELSSCKYFQEFVLW